MNINLIMQKTIGGFFEELFAKRVQPCGIKQQKYIINYTEYEHSTVIYSRTLSAQIFLALVQEKVFDLKLQLNYF